MRPIVWVAYRRQTSPSSGWATASPRLLFGKPGLSLKVSVWRAGTAGGPPLVVDVLFREGGLWRHTTMAISVDERQDEIAAACRQYYIERLFIFGSAIREDFKAGESDIDLLVEFGPMDVTKKFHVYLDAREAFRRIFKADVDLVMRGAVKNKIIAREIDSTMKLIYAA
mgnify:CR=1 FL=1